MLTRQQLNDMYDLRQNILDGIPYDSNFSGDWFVDLFNMLESMALRNEVLRNENAELRRVMKLKKAE